MDVGGVCPEGERGIVAVVPDNLRNTRLPHTNIAGWIEIGVGRLEKSLCLGGSAAMNFVP
jgi:hypothetical protein